MSMNTAIIARAGATDAQKHGAQSEVFQRLVNPVGFVSKSAPTTFRNEADPFKEGRSWMGSGNSRGSSDGSRTGKVHTGTMGNRDNRMPDRIFPRTANEDRSTAADYVTPVGNKALTTKGRSQIAKKNFALPGGRYPIHDASHARNALARVSQNGTPAEKAAVRAKVHAKFPGIGG
jgi:hypothetical protein